MSKANKSHFGSGAQSKHAGNGAMTDVDHDKVGENMVLSNRDKKQHGEGRGADSAQVQNDQYATMSAIVPAMIPRSNRFGRPTVGACPWPSVRPSTRSSGRSELRPFNTLDDGRPGDGSKLQFYRQATDKIVGLSCAAAKFSAASSDSHHPIVPEPPLNGPTMFEVIQPP